VGVVGRGGVFVCGGVWGGRLGWRVGVRLGLGGMRPGEMGVEEQAGDVHDGNLMGMRWGKHSRRGEIEKA
jgi:hypothetical protein